MVFPERVTLVEVGPRDGLQNEARPVSAADKIALVHALQAAGLRHIEVTSFVSPRWVPQMADNAEVMAGMARAPGVRYAVLTPNMKGLEAALASRPDEVVVFAAATEAFSQRNINCSIDESFERFRPLVAEAHRHGIKVRGAVSCALGCPYQGEVSGDEVERVVRLMKEVGVDHCGVADTIGTGTPRRVQQALERALRHYSLGEVSGHFHDTWGQALANVYASLEMGVHTFDASVGGLGGCPYAKGATGNVATEDVLYLLDGLGIETGVDLERLVDAAAGISQALGRPVASRVGRAVLARRERSAAP
ncbi:hydroxymethylglutaryl-CoA lyase [Rhizobacter sp. LjRoot28]|uniref:hydroxymethylglutaryl-CoA lyase n=1 Tax=Rhizobacter sp. LjRoot28 TaxID=3342309 RepID=UPI003ED01CF8